MSSRLPLEPIKRGKTRWLRMWELPCSRSFVYKIIGELTTVIVKPPGSKKGIRLVDADSFDAYIEKLASEQKGYVIEKPRRVPQPSGTKISRQKNRGQL